jgi:hypothetical protein
LLLFAIFSPLDLTLRLRRAYVGLPKESRLPKQKLD